MRGRGRLFALAFVASLAVTACPSNRQPLTAEVAADFTLAGTVFLPARFQTKAEIKDVAVAATVSLIDPRKNRTVATSLTDNAGGFVLTFGGGFVPETGAYILCSLKSQPLV